MESFRFVSPENNKKTLIFLPGITPGSFLLIREEFF